MGLYSLRWVWGPCCVVLCWKHGKATFLNSFPKTSPHQDFLWFGEDHCERFQLSELSNIQTILRHLCWPKDFFPKPSPREMSLCSLASALPDQIPGPTPRVSCLLQPSGIYGLRIYEGGKRMKHHSVGKAQVIMQHLFGHGGQLWFLPWIHAREMAHDWNLNTKQREK